MLVKNGKLPGRSIIRGLLALFISVAVGIAVLLGGVAVLPDAPVPSEDVFNALANGSLDPPEAAHWNHALRMPGRLLFWGVCPIAALAVGAVAYMIDQRRGMYLAPVAFSLIWAMVVWGSTIDRYSLLMGSVYVALAILGARLAALRRASAIR